MTSKVRPAWASSSAPEREQDASAVDTAAPEEYATLEGQVRDQDADPEPGQHEPENASSGDQSRRVCTVPAADEPHPREDHDHRSEDGACAASSFGKETMDSDAGEPSYPSPAGSALTRIKAAISSFVERISGKRQSVPGGAGWRVRVAVVEPASSRDSTVSRMLSACWQTRSSSLSILHLGVMIYLVPDSFNYNSRGR